MFNLIILFNWNWSIIPDYITQYFWSMESLWLWFHLNASLTVKKYVSRSNQRNCHAKWIVMTKVIYNIMIDCEAQTVGQWRYSRLCEIWIVPSMQPSIYIVYFNINDAISWVDKIFLFSLNLS